MVDFRRLLPLALALSAAPLLQGIQQCGSCDDADGDEVCDDVDVCPGGDDYLDADGDTVPDACDVCPAGDDRVDSDQDTIADACDVCLAGDDRVDADLDTVPDGCDVCPNADDRQDTDADATPDDCDVCANDATNDADGDGLCNGTPYVTTSGLPADMAILQRDDADQRELVVSGKVGDPGYSSITLTVYRGDTVWQQTSSPVSSAGKTPYELSVSIPAGLVNHRLVLSLQRNGQEVIIADRHDIAVGDLVLIEGQSNAVAGDYAGEGLANQEQSPWIRSFGSASTDPSTAAADLSWGMAEAQAYNTHASIGIWGLRLGVRMLETLQVPIGILNGAVGGTTLDQNRRNDANAEDLNTIYGRSLYRANRSGFADGARLLVWYQGESDGSGTGDGSTADTYPERFDDLYRDWKEDYTALQQLYVFQVRNGCGLDHPGDSTLKVNFQNSVGSTIASSQLDFWAGPSWAEYGLRATVPASASKAQVTMNPVAYGAVDYDDAGLMGADGSNRVANPSFETGDRAPESWTFSGRGESTYVTTAGHTGSRMVSLEAQNQSISVNQTVAVTAGEALSISVFAQRENTSPWHDVREALRSLPDSYPDLDLVATNGAPGHDTCHFKTAGYQLLGDWLSDRVLQDLYAVNTGAVETLQAVSARWQDATTLRVQLTDDLPVTAELGVEQNFRIEGAYVTGLTVAGTELILTLSQPTAASTLAYSDKPGESADVLNARGEGLAAFTGLLISN